MIAQGATSMWERWDGYVKGRASSGGGAGSSGSGEFQDPGMNSFNHFAFGAIGEWMVRTIGGINPDPAAPGWSHAIIRPIPGGNLTWARTRYRSIRGEFATSWTLDTDRFTLDLTIPPNTTATVYFPSSDSSTITETDQPLADADGVTVGGIVGDSLMLEVRPGTYRLSGPMQK
jgi:alpha-L-rhamnosidase